MSQELLWSTPSTPVFRDSALEWEIMQNATDAAPCALSGHGTQGILGLVLFNSY